MSESIEGTTENWESGTLGLSEEHAEKASPIADRGACNHAHYSLEKHGRRCTCGAWLTDFGD